MRSRLLILMALVLATTAACSLADLGAGDNPGRDGQGFAGSRVKTYATLLELGAEASVVVLVTVASVDQVSADKKGETGILSDLVHARVDQALLGEPRDAVDFRLPFSWKQDDATPHLEDGHAYVVFLGPFSWHHGRQADQLIVPGGAGIYGVDDGTLTLLSDPSADPLPLHPSLADIAAAVTYDGGT